MAKKILILCTGILGLLAPRHELNAFLAHGSIVLTIEVLVNPSEGAQRSACTRSRELLDHWREEWWFTVADEDSLAPDGEESTVSGIRCEEGAWEEAQSKIQSYSGRPFLVVGASILALVRKQMEGERVAKVQVKVLVRELSEAEEGHDAPYRETEIRRDIHFSDNGAALVPLYVSDRTDRSISGVAEVFLRIDTRVVEDESAGKYGSIWLTTALDEGRVLLDGGVVGNTPTSGEMTLRNVPVGLREVRVRDDTGHEWGQVVRVEASRTVVVDLSHPTAAETQGLYGLTPLGKNSQGYEEFRRVADGAVVVKIPAGEFLMGNEEAERSPPEHRVYVTDFLMDKTGVTWSQYKQFSSKTGIPLPPHEPYWGIHDDHPVVYVTWEEAKAFCEWAGGRLSTEAEREKAARGTDGRMYPWGAEEPTPEHGVYRRSWGKEATAAVGTHPAGVSPYGLHDMGGNVWEWCSDWYGRDYLANSPYRNPKGPPSGTTHVLRGGSWDSRPSVLSASVRNWGHRGYREGDFGFRCAMNVPE